jgi:hypothetical protein
LTLLALGKTGVHSHAIQTWFDKDEAGHTWANFQLHFNKHEKTWLNKLTAQAARFHSAQKGSSTVPTVNTLPPAAYQAGKSKGSYKSNGIPLFYCWSHGLSKNLEHTSRTCNYQSDGHRPDATIDNRPGGINKINIGRSGKPCRVIA